MTTTNEDRLADALEPGQVEFCPEFAGASTDELADAVAQRLELLGPQHLFDAWAAATARYWRRRADSFDAARPTRDGFHGRASQTDVNACWERLTAIAQACRNRAEMAERYGLTPADRALLSDVASALVVA